MTSTALPLLAGLLLLSPPDIIPDNMRPILIESRMDAKALAAEHCLGYVLQKGDTLRDLARTHLGDEARWPEIERLNPLVGSDKLRPGELVWLPPRDAAAAKRELVFAFIDTGRPFTRSAKPLVDAAAVAPSHYGGIGVFLVPESSLPAFREALASMDKRRSQRTDALQALIATGKVTDIDGRAPGRLVATNDPSAKRTDTYSFAQGADGKFTLRVTSIAYDKDGKPIDPRAGNHDDGAKKEQALLLFLLAAAGGGFLLQRARMRRQTLARDRVNGRRQLALALAVLATAIAAVQAPLWTYALSLALFGLPHVLVELRYVDERFTARVPRRTALVLAAMLAGIVALRVLAASGAGGTVPRTTAELALGCLLVAATLPALARLHRTPLAGATLLALGAGLAVAPIDTLVVFAVLHNLTPLGFLAERLRGRQRRAALWLGSFAFGVVPLLIATGMLRPLLANWCGDWIDSGPFATGTLDLHLPVFVLPSLLGTTHAVDLFATGAYLQCMHYAVVLHVLPRLGGGSEANGALVRWRRPGQRLLLLGGSAVMASGFAFGFAEARSLYAVAAALHAWLEIPILLLACGLAPRGAAATLPAVRAA